MVLGAGLLFLILAAIMIWTRKLDWYRTEVARMSSQTGEPGEQAIAGTGCCSYDNQCESPLIRPMPAKKRVSSRSLQSDLARVDAHVIRASEYEELPELTEEMLARAKRSKGGRPVAANPRRQVTIRLPADVLARWKATGPGWQTRMAERLSRMR